MASALAIVGIEYSLNYLIASDIIILMSVSGLPPLILVH